LIDDRRSTGTVLYSDSTVRAADRYRVLPSPANQFQGYYVHILTLRTEPHNHEIKLIRTEEPPTTRRRHQEGSAEEKPLYYY
jgi:hypothetical protein